MLEGQRRRMQGKAFMGPGDLLPEMWSISGVAKHGVARFGKMNPDLIATTRFEANRHMSDRGTQ